MKHMVTAALLAATALTAGAARAEGDIPEKAKPMPRLTVELDGVDEGGVIPTRFAYCRPDGRGQSRDSDNISPEISWRDVPENTRSFAIIVVDKDVPADFGPANKLGKEIETKAPRRDFYHWVAYDLPATLRKIPEGKASNGLVKNGKPTGKMSYGITGVNDFGQRTGGYDGPCPPWNDKRLHSYHFRVYALDVPTLNAPAIGIDGKGLEKLLGSHTLARGEIVGTYSNNVDVLGTLKTKGK